MRLDLPRYHCVRLTLSSEFTVSTERDADIRSLMNQTATHTHDPVESDEEGELVAFFGSRFRVGGITHQVRGTLGRTPTKETRALSSSL